jgi:hypothetical protein
MSFKPPGLGLGLRGVDLFARSSQWWRDLIFSEHGIPQPKKEKAKLRPVSAFVVTGSMLKKEPPDVHLP